jgi:hypothetical protein
MNGTWTRERTEAYLTPDQDGFDEIEAGLRSSRPVTRLTPRDRRCVHAYHTMSPLSVDGSMLIWYEFNDPRPDMESGRPLSGRVVVAEANGASARPIAEMAAGSPCQGVMQQWAGPTHRVGFNNMTSVTEFSQRTWTVIDVDTDESWSGEGMAREFAPNGRDVFIQTPEQIHLWAQDQGGELAPEEIATYIRDYMTGEERVRVSVADVGRPPRGRAGKPTAHVLQADALQSRRQAHLLQLQQCLVQPADQG